MDYASRIVFEIVGKKFVYRGWTVRGEHMCEVKPSQIIDFGETGVQLRLVKGEPKLTAPENQRVELLKSDYAFKDGQPVHGKFVEVRIY